MLQDSPLDAYLPATDVDRARRFHEQTLGLPPAREIAGGVCYEFDGRTAAFLYESPNAGTSKASHAFWRVDGVIRAR